MDKITKFNLPDHVNTLYEKEASSSIALTKEVADKINELIEAYNQLSQMDLEWKQTQEGTIRKAVVYMKDNLLNSLNDLMVLLRDSGFIDERIEFHCDSLKAQLNNLLGTVKEGTTTMDAEIIDGRVSRDDTVYQNIGQHIRQIEMDILSYSSSAMAHVYSGRIDIDTTNKTIKIVDVVLYDDNRFYPSSGKLNAELTFDKNTCMLVYNRLENAFEIMNFNTYKKNGGVHVLSNAFGNIMCFEDSKPHIFVNGEATYNGTGKGLNAYAKGDVIDGYFDINTEEHWIDCEFSATFNNHAITDIVAYIEWEDQPNPDYMRFFGYNVLKEEFQIIPLGGNYVRGFVLLFAVYGGRVYHATPNTLKRIRLNGKPYSESESKSKLSGLNIACIGDSFTSPEYGWVKMLSDRTGCNCQNLGVSGAKIKNEYLNSSGELVKSLYSMVENSAFDSDIIILFGGLNDTIDYKNDYDFLGDIGEDESSDTLYGHIMDLILSTRLSRPNALVVCVIPPSSCYTDPKYAVMGTHIEPIQQAIRECCHKFGIPYIDLARECQAMCSYFEEFVEMYRSEDGFHPNTAGHEKICDTIQAKLESILP